METTTDFASYDSPLPAGALPTHTPIFRRQSGNLIGEPPGDSAMESQGVPVAPRPEEGHLLEHCNRLQAEIQRGREFLEQVRNNLSVTRKRLEECTAYEQHCGTQALALYTQILLPAEQTAQFLPHWLKWRENELEAITRQMGGTRNA